LIEKGDSINLHDSPLSARQESNEYRNGEDKSPMKRLAPERRNQLIKDHIRHLVSDWTCRYGEWNRQKLLAELESALKARRRKDKGN
jgi:hypothetical protein